MTVDDEPVVLSTIERDLQVKYGDRFCITTTNSGSKAIDLIKKSKLSCRTVALFIVDQRMPQMSGIKFLQYSLEIYPDAKRVLLTDNSDSEAIMMSINKGRIDYYLTKPWQPPELHLYPALNDILDDWWLSFKPPYEGIKVIG